MVSDWAVSSESSLVLVVTLCSTWEKVASCATNWLESIGCVGSWFLSWAMSSLRNALVVEVAGRRALASWRLARLETDETVVMGLPPFRRRASRARRAARSRMASSSGNSARSRFSASKMLSSSTSPGNGEQLGADRLVGEGGHGGGVHLAKEGARRLGVARVHEQRLDDEIELAERRRRLLRLHHVAFEDEDDLVEELQRHLAIGAHDRAVDVDALARLQRDLDVAAHDRPSRIILLTSMRAEKPFDGSARTRSDSATAHTPMAMRSRLSDVVELVARVAQVLDEERPQLLDVGDRIGDLGAIGGLGLGRGHQRDGAVERRLLALACGAGAAFHDFSVGHLVHGWFPPVVTRSSRGSSAAALPSASRTSRSASSAYRSSPWPPRDRRLRASRCGSPESTAGSSTARSPG